MDATSIAEPPHKTPNAPSQLSHWSTSPLSRYHHAHQHLQSHHPHQSHPRLAHLVLVNCSNIAIVAIVDTSTGTVLFRVAGRC